MNIRVGSYYYSASKDRVIYIYEKSKVSFFSSKCEYEGMAYSLDGSVSISFTYNQCGRIYKDRTCWLDLGEEIDVVRMIIKSMDLNKENK